MFQIPSQGINITDQMALEILNRTPIMQCEDHDASTPGEQHVWINMWMGHDYPVICIPTMTEAMADEALTVLRDLKDRGMDPVTIFDAVQTVWPVEVAEPVEPLIPIPDVPTDAPPLEPTQEAPQAPSPEVTLPTNLEDPLL